MVGPTSELHEDLNAAAIYTNEKLVKSCWCGFRLLIMKSGIRSVRLSLVFAIKRK